MIIFFFQNRDDNLSGLKKYVFEVLFTLENQRGSICVLNAYF